MRSRRTSYSTATSLWLCDLLHSFIKPGVILVGLPYCGWRKRRAMGTTVGFNFLRKEISRGGSLSLSFLTGLVMSVYWGCNLTEFRFLCLQCTVRAFCRAAKRSSNTEHRCTSICISEPLLYINSCNLHSQGLRQYDTRLEFRSQWILMG
jgi:hypothetical protein